MMGRITTRRRAERVDHRDLLLFGIPKPAVISRAWIGAQERVIHDIIARIDLAVDLALVAYQPERPSSGIPF
jgi:hypothetical protein